MTVNWGRKINQRGAFLLEALVTLLLFAVLAMILMSSSVFALQIRGRNMRLQVATELAANTIESYAAFDPVTLTNADDLTEIVVEDGITFIREIDVTVNTNQSRTVDVEVGEEEGHLAVNAQASSTFSLWGTQ